MTAFFRSRMPGFERLSPANQEEELRHRLCGVSTLISLHFFMGLVWIFLVLIPNFCGSLVPLPVWAAAPVFLYYVFSQTLYYGPTAEDEHVVRSAWFFYVVLVLDLGAKITQIVFLSIELFEMVSPIYLDPVGFSFLWVCMAMSIVWVLLDAWIFWRVLFFVRGVRVHAGYKQTAARVRAPMRTPLLATLRGAY